MAMTLALPQYANAETKCDYMQHSIHIIEEGRDEEPHSSPDDVRNPLFRDYVEAVSQHVLAKFPPAAGATESSDENASVELFFVHRPLIGSAPASAGLPVDDPAPAGARSLDSPWVKLAIAPPPACSVRGVFIWSERQILLDQAVMAGADVSADEPLLPIEEEAFEQFANEYAQSVILEPSPEARAEALDRISQHIPPDILWLFRHSWQSTRGPFSDAARSALNAAMESASTGYVNLAKGLVDHRLASNENEERYASVLDLSNVFGLTDYRIGPLH